MSLPETEPAIAALPGGFVPDTIITVSDLHLGKGMNPADDRFAPGENFFADRRFAAFLDHHARAIPGARLLLLNGDVFDFVRIDTRPESNADYDEWSALLAELGALQPPDVLRARTRSEKKFGLRTNDYKSVWKLLCMWRGHRAFFRALGSWVEGGGRIVYTKGNHDLEVYWPLVQEAICLLIAKGPPVLDRAMVRDRIQFVQGGLAVGNIYVEHGHRFEATTTVYGGPVRNKGTELNLPLGSFVNRYIVNALECFEPFLDNVKPVTRMLKTMVTRHPVWAFRLAWQAIPFLQRAARPYWWRQSLGFTLFFASFLVPLITVVLILLQLKWSALTNWLPAPLRIPLGTVGLVLPYVLAAAHDLFPKKKPNVGDDEWAEAIHDRVKEVFPAPAFTRLFGVIGHTHRTDCQDLPGIGSARVTYLNSGTWIPRWDEGRPDLTGRVIYSFIEFTRQSSGEYSHRHLEWQAEVGRAEPSTILSPTA